jgi:hypothetical protein
LANKSQATQVPSSLKTSRITETTALARVAKSTTISYDTESTALDKYIKNVRAMNKRTAIEYHRRLLSFQDFVISNYNTTLDRIITSIKEGSEDPYEILSDYVAHLQTNYNISTLTLKQRVVTIKNFFEYYDVDISPKKFKLKVKNKNKIIAYALGKCGRTLEQATVFTLLAICF